jgi:hypothetical protein
LVIVSAKLLKERVHQVTSTFWLRLCGQRTHRRVTDVSREHIGLFGGVHELGFGGQP